MEYQTPALEKLIKPNMVANLPCFDAEAKAKYYNGITEQYRKISQYPQGHPEHAKALKTLADVTSRVTTLMKIWRQEHPPGGVPAGQQAQPGHSGAGQNNPMLQMAPNETYSEAVKAKVQSLSIAIPPHLYNRSEQEIKAWVLGEKRKVANWYQGLERAQKAVGDLNAMISARTSQHASQPKPFTDHEKEMISQRRRDYQIAHQTANDNLKNWYKQQEQYKAAQEHAKNMPMNRPDGGSHTTQQPHANPPPHQGNNLPVPTDQSLTANSAPGSVNPSENLGEDTMAGTTGPQGQAASNTGPQNSQAEPTKPSGTTGPQHSHSHHSPQITAAQGPTSSQGPHPLSHKAAMAQAARSYSQTGVPQSTPNSNPHAHPSMPRETQNPSSKWPMSKTLQVQPLTPVSMGPSRPTLSGGPGTGAGGPMGQPAVQKYPGFVLEGEGERVLSKKKLEELVRQVTGGSDGDGAESLDPDVEETLLDVADEFVDNVISAACKLAKLRQSATLEVRDLQLILERNYNIRVPGYASDELRTVKKIQPTPAWAQKISAINAAKLTGGKSDI